MVHESRRDRPAKLAAWKTRMATETFFVPRDAGVLWTGISAATAAKLAAEQRPPLTTLEMTPLGRRLDHGDLAQELSRDFGESWKAEKREVFKVASSRFAESLSGRVTLFLPRGLNRPRNGAPGSFAYAVKILWDELRDADFGDPRKLTHRIDSMRICWVEGGRIVDDQFMIASNWLH